MRNVELSRTWLDDFHLLCVMGLKDYCLLQIDINRFSSYCVILFAPKILMRFK